MRNLKTSVKILLFFLLLFISLGPLWGQACCSGGTPLSSNLGLQAFSKGDWQFKLIYDYNTQRTLMSGDQKLRNNPRQRNTHSGLFRVSYGMNKALSISVLFSLLRQEERIEKIGGGKGLIKAEGLGDAVALFQWSLLANDQWNVLAGLGGKIPWGATGRINAETGFEVHPDMQPGTGSWDFLGSLSMIKNNVVWPSASFNASLTYRLTNPADRYNGLQEYEFGDEIQLIFGLKDQRFWEQWIFGPSLMLRYRYTQDDLLNGFASPNTGGHWLFLNPGLDIDLFQGFQLTFMGEFPLYRNLNGTQLTTTYQIRLGLVYNIAGRTDPFSATLQN